MAGLAITKKPRKPREPWKTGTVGKKSKTGSPECSAAMSTWQRARHAGQSVAAAVWSILGKCRSMARQRNQAAAHAAAGRELMAQHLNARLDRQGINGAITQADRRAKARQLLEQRAARPGMGRATERKGVPLARAESPPIPAASAAMTNRQAGRVPRSEKATPAERLAAIRARSSARESAQKYHFDGRKYLPTAAEVNAELKRQNRAEVHQPRATASPLIDQAQAAAARVPASRMAGGRVMLHHVWAEYRRTGGKLGLAEFKQRLADDPEARIKLGLGRHDLTQTRRQADLRAAGVTSGPAEFHTMRVANYASGTGEKLSPRSVPRVSREEAKKASALVAHKRAARTPQPVEHATIGHTPGEKFSLLQRSAKGSKGAVNLGRGTTKFMFDMKRGDKPGQTSIFDRGELVSRQTSKMGGALSYREKVVTGVIKTPPNTYHAKRRAAAAEMYDLGGAKVSRADAISILRHKGHTEQAIDQFLRNNKVTAASGKGPTIEQRLATALGKAKAARLVGDDEARSRWSKQATALAALKAGQKATKRGGWNMAPESERSAAAALVAKVRAGKALPKRDPNAAAKAKALHEVADRAEAKAAAAQAAGKESDRKAWAVLAARNRTTAEKWDAINSTFPKGIKGALKDAEKPTSSSSSSRQTSELQYGGDRVEQALRRLTPREALQASRSKTAERLAVARAAEQRAKAPETHAKPGETHDVGTAHIHFDPERFQYKLAAQGAHGVTDQLKGVGAWDPELAGAVSVWRDPADNKVYVVNGHHRLDLAKRLGVEKITAKFLNAPTAEHARAKGALVNIAEGRGTALDAAKFFREPIPGQGPMTVEHLKSRGVSLKEHTASQGLAMAALHPKIFDRVVSGEISHNRASIIGGAGLTHAQQAELQRHLDKPQNRKLTDGTVRELAAEAKAAGSKTKEVRDLFGSSQEEQSLFTHRAVITDSIKRSLAADERLFGLVAKSKAAQKLAERGDSTINTEATGQVADESRKLLQYFDHLKRTDPRIYKPLNDAAERLANGEDRKRVEAETRGKLTKTMRAILSGEEGAFS